jgi:hypothetical protein
LFQVIKNPLHGGMLAGTGGFNNAVWGGLFGSGSQGG